MSHFGTICSKIIPVDYKTYISKMDCSFFVLILHLSLFNLKYISETKTWVYIENDTIFK